MTTATQTQKKSDGIGRRDFVKGIGATAAAGVGLASTNGPVGDAEAIAPAIVVGATAVAGSAALGWALREYEVIGSDSPPEGLTADALKQGVYESARARKSTNESTFVDNMNILEGAEHTAYVEAKIGAIEALNDQDSQDDVAEAAQDALDEYISVIEENLLKSWNESVHELRNIIQTGAEHEDFSDGDLVQLRSEDGDDEWEDGPEHDGWNDGGTHEHELPNGDTIDVEQVDGDLYGDVRSGGATDLGTTAEHRYTPVQTDLDYDLENPYVIVTALDDTFEYLKYEDWGSSGVYGAIKDLRDNVSDGITLWVDNVYSDVQSGEIDVEELITPRERAAMMAEDEGMAQAIADLQALNIPIDVEREATIFLPHVDATIRGTLGITQDQSIESGETYDPESDIDGSVYLTYDVSLGEGTWDGYEDGVDGGEVTFTDEPFPGTTFRIHTTAGESVEVVDDDFTPVDEDGDDVDDWEDPDRWLVDISDDVDDAITEIDEVEYFASDDASEFETIQLQDEFTVERIEDTSSGEEADSMEFESSEPQSDDNYITQEEWDEMEEQNQELIERYEESQSDGIGIGFGFLDGDSDLGLLAIVGLAVLVAWEVLTN